MIIQQLIDQITVLKELLFSLSDQQYTQKINFLSDASIGAHSRHIIELIKCLTNGYTDGKVDYINRERNLLIEQNRVLAIEELDALVLQLDRKDRMMELLSEAHNKNYSIMVSTTYFREIEYNKEHTIHHLALIRVALREMNLSLVNESFGVAHATLKFLAKQKNLQS
jgi:hypothetical protein